MKIVVVGAGQVGQAVAKDLAQTHDIIVVDLDAERLDDLRYQADVLTYEGDGGDIDVLKEVKAAEADIIIASTDNDHINILVCGIARLLSQKVLTIARVTDSEFLKAWKTSKKAFSVDMMVGSNFLTATSIVQVAFEQMAQEVEFFDEGRIKMAEFNVPADCHLAGKTVREADIYGGLRYAAVFHDGNMEVARGATKIPSGSRILVIGRPKAV
ncbi:MAG: NAD-binding protein, partial [Bradymonadaceae bacterium]